MPKFSARSLLNLASCDLDLQILFHEVIKNFDCIITDGYRNKEAQDEAFNSGKSKVQWPNGKHNQKPSQAADVYSYPINFDDEKLAVWFGGYVQGIAQKLKDEGKMTHSIRWGGAWSGLGKLNTGNMLSDIGHFELFKG